MVLIGSSEQSRYTIPYLQGLAIEPKRREEKSKLLTRSTT